MNAPGVRLADYRIVARVANTHYCYVIILPRFDVFPSFIHMGIDSALILPILDLNSLAKVNSCETVPDDEPSQG